MKRIFTIILVVASLVCHAYGGVKEALAAKNSGDYQTARKEFQTLAEKGDDKAMIELGVMYHTGQGVKQDYGKAMDWYLKAFAKDNGDAYSNIGVLYRDGLGCETNRPIAYALFYITHMRGLGSEDTQYRAGRNLDKTAALMKSEEIQEALKMTEEYVLTFVQKRGKLDEKDNALKFSNEKGSAPEQAFVAVALSNETNAEIEEARVYFGEYRCSAGILGPGGTKTYVGWDRPITTNAIVRWRDARKMQQEQSVSLIGIYEPTFDGDLTFSIGVSNVTAKFKRINRR